MAFPDLRRECQHPHRCPPETSGSARASIRPAGIRVDAVRLLVGLHRLQASRNRICRRSDPDIDGIRQTFTNKELEGRVEVRLLPFNLRFAE